jgi:hypothetical protein
MSDSDKELAKLYVIELKEIDKSRAKLLFFIIWDIRYNNNLNSKDYNWRFFEFRYQTIIGAVIFNVKGGFFSSLNDAKIPLNFSNIRKAGDLPFYDPENNMEFFNRLFDVLGIYEIIGLEDSKYYVSDKYDFRR